MPRKEIFDKIGISIPNTMKDQKPVERLAKLAEKKDRSVNYLVVDAMLQYLKRGKAKG